MSDASGRYQVWVGQVLYHTHTPQETASVLRACALDTHHRSYDRVSVEDLDLKPDANDMRRPFIFGTLADVAALLGDEPPAKPKRKPTILERMRQEERERAARIVEKRGECEPTYGSIGRKGLDELAAQIRGTSDAKAERTCGHCDVPGCYETPMKSEEKP